jgi:magnesium-transporting ATPase (P-type)
MAQMQGQPKSFPIEIRELTDLLQVQLKPDEQQEFLSQHGHVAGLMKKLKTNPQTGLSNENKQDLLNRATQFGKNEIPAKPPKSFFYLMWEAVQDTTLIILIFGAVISLIVSLFNFEETRDLGEEYSIRSNFKPFVLNVFLS